MNYKKRLIISVLINILLICFLMTFDEIYFKLTIELFYKYFLSLDPYIKLIETIPTSTQHIINDSTIMADNHYRPITILRDKPITTCDLIPHFKPCSTPPHPNSSFGLAIPDIDIFWSFLGILTFPITLLLYIIVEFLK